ncbi:LysM peptidoglycan-binding domain-containing protein [Actinoplanes sp. CA-015351]|uniref:LysM peptidoglycan-binding domain-containing protein n=1 Tax=Actinoplanes sp. CA-015351 TaxID=3239897 RepID=UPI003D972D0A
MARLSHGKPLTEKDLTAARDEFAAFSAESSTTFALTGTPPPGPFDLLFPDLQDDPENLVEETPQTPGRLSELGTAMADPDVRGEDSPIPAVYTYFGQFVDHDITLEIQEPGSGTMDQLLDTAMKPLPLHEVRKALRNRRTATLDLDSVYDPAAPREPDGKRMLVGKVSKTPSPNEPFKRPDGKDDFNDLPRLPRNDTFELDRAARIGDPRNDENTIISQLHTAFLRAHNALVKQGLSFEIAQRTLRQHYQHVVIEDFLHRVCDKAIVDDVVKNGNRWYDPWGASFFMPLEFSVAAYRFGHSMVRAGYNFNTNFNFADRRPATLELLFTFSALSGQLGDFDTLPENWIIEWENIVGDAGQKTRKIDTTLAKVGDLGLFNLQTVDGEREKPDLAARLAVRNLLRGYRLRLPTGQAVATLLGFTPLTADQLLAATGDVNGDQAEALRKGSLTTRTPLWYYILAEAAHEHQGERLGKVGSTIVAEVLVGLVRRSEDSILKIPGWRPTLPSAKAGTFELADILRLAGVLGGGGPAQPPAPSTYTVKDGDTLTGIARSQLGDEKRWPQIFVLNRKDIRDPNRILPGQVFLLPPREPVGPIPKLYTVKKGDTLFDIARAQLGDGNRWPEIFRLNRDIIDNPDRIIPGQVLVIPG